MKKKRNSTCNLISKSLSFPICLICTLLQSRQAEHFMRLNVRLAGHIYDAMSSSQEAFIE